jgi:hypothetical protein
LVAQAVPAVPAVAEVAEVAAQDAPPQPPVLPAQGLAQWRKRIAAETRTEAARNAKTMASLFLKK